MFRIVLSSQQSKFLLRNSSFLSDPLRKILLESGTDPHGRVILEISRKTVEQFRDEFTSRVAQAGFDSEYGLTAEGEALEDLNDTFYEYLTDESSSSS